MLGWYFVAIPNGGRWFQIEDIVKIEDSLTEASAWVRVNGKDTWGSISVDDVDEIMKIKPEIVEMTVPGMARKVLIEHGLDY